MKARKLIWATAEGKKRMAEPAKYGLDITKDRQELLADLLDMKDDEGRPLAHSSWVVVYAINGKRYQRTFDKKKDADAWIVRTQLDVRNGAHVPDSASITVRQAGERWIEACRNGTADRPALERATVEGYEQHLKHHILPYLGDLKLSRLTPETVRDFLSKLANGTPPPGEDEAKPRSRGLITKVRGSLGALLAEARLPRNVVYEQRRPRGARKVGERHEDDLEIGTDIPKPDEIGAIIRTLDEGWQTSRRRRWRPLILTAIFTGLRASELRGLRWKDVDFEKQRLQVRQRRDRYNEAGPPKTKAGRRTVPLTPKLVAVLREWKLACPKGRDDLVFPNRKGKPENLGNIVNRCWWPLQIEAGVADVVKDAGGVVVGEGDEPVRKPRYSGFHALRHFYASWCINEAPGGLGLPPKTVQTRLGHSSITMTMDTYGHLFPDQDDSEKSAAGEARLWSQYSTDTA
jgi:integrase